MSGTMTTPAGPPAEMTAEPTANAPTTAPAPLRVGGLTRYTHIDYPGEAAAVVYVQGCPWRCVYCHNPELQPRAGTGVGPDWTAMLDWLGRRVGLLDAVVFSGGEPTIDRALPAALQAVRGLGFKTGLHTAGIYPSRLEALLPWLDWVGFDVKAPLDDAAAHAQVTGVRAGQRGVSRSLQSVLRSGVSMEVRTTIHPSLHDDDTILRLAGSLATAGVRRYALQRCRSVGCEAAQLGPVPADYPAPKTLERVATWFEQFKLRDA